MTGPPTELSVELLEEGGVGQAPGQDRELGPERAGQVAHYQSKPAMREDFQRVMADRYKHTIQELTGRKVLAFLSQAHVEPDITMEIFFIDGPLEGFGAVEITEPELSGGREVSGLNT